VDRVVVKEPLKGEFFNLVQKACLPGIWSKGVALARSDSVLVDNIRDGNLVFRVKVADRPVTPKVTLWPDDDDWFCDCNDRNDVCAHVAAVVIFIKTGKEIDAKSPSQNHTAELNYRFYRLEGKLYLERWIVQSGVKEERLTSSLVSLIGGISSGRLRAPPVAATQSDFALDSILMSQQKSALDRAFWVVLFKELASCSNITLDGIPITVASKPIQFRICLSDEANGFRLKMEEDPSVTEFFKNGVVLCGTVLRGIESFLVSPEERAMISGDGRFFSFHQTRELVTEILPALEKKVAVHVQSQRLPKAKQVVPRIVLRLDRANDSDTLSVIPRLEYGNEKDAAEANEILVSDPVEEKRVRRQLQHDLQLVPGQQVYFHGEAAVNFVLKLGTWETQGDGVESFRLQETLDPRVYLDSGKFELMFESDHGSKKADPNRVFQNWRENLNYVPLLGGGWARLPKDWLEKYGERIQEFLDAKRLNDELPNYLLPQAQAFCDEIGQSVSLSVRRFNENIHQLKAMGRAELPKDLTADLRSYQMDGVNWLCFLRDGHIGALLADDMGLGKTLQSLCAIRGRTLVITPTSVLQAWAEQIQKYRPKLTYSVYYGSQRQLDSKIEVTITTYALLRLDKNRFNQEKWDTIILDEAQIIKNPDSQVSKAVHSLDADFKIALSGTPVENRLEDLWSQFQFLNPGLLGSLETFQEQFATPIAKGDATAAERLRQRVRPFILRRLKKDVAPELPPRTEKVLYCELSSTEREIYEAILASTRSEVIEKLETGGSVFAALELLLRLRQACCHTSMLPGQVSQSSSKLDLLIETLQDSVESGHRALVFSQWTSYLDLIEPQLKNHGISFSRLDGTTRNREELVLEFQKETGPSVMLISLKAGGVGLTLTAADHIFIMDPWWNPAVEDQAADRAHRLGQTNPVLIHRLVAQGTIEERILEMKKLKQQVAEAILQGTGAATSVTRDDILSLLM
jgi:superfamily II DNA or RNA helicase